MSREMTVFQKVKTRSLKLPSVNGAISPRRASPARGIPYVPILVQPHRHPKEWPWVLNVFLVHIFVFAVLQQEDSLPMEFQMVTKPRSIWSINRKSSYTVPMGPSNKDFSLKCSCLSNAAAFNPFTPVGPTCLH